MTKAGSGDDKPDFTAIEAKVKEAMQRLQVPGVAIGVISGEHEFAGGYGITNIENAVGVDTSTLFQIGSNTKTMTATVLMRLVEQDKISLDAPVRQYLPDFKLKDEAVAASVTVRELFTHRAGWLGDFFEDTGDGDDALAKYVAKMADIPQRAPRDLLWSYNNAAFNLAGRLIEVVTGKTYEASVKELLFEPLGMNESLFFPREIMTRKFATGHAPGENGLEIARLWPLPRSVNAAGGVSASLNDMLRYAKFHLGDGTASDGTRLLSADSLAYLQTPLAEAGSIADQIGLSWMLRDVEGVRIVQHGGGTNGHISALMLAPAKKFALVILTNSQRGGELNGELSKWLLQEYLGIEEPVPDGIVLPKESLAGYVGRYTTNYATIEVALNDGGLIGRKEPPDSAAQPAPENPLFQARHGDFDGRGAKRATCRVFAGRRR
jgi:CubicO group peptidase (beta-lactamase class C family)